jgi:hypothetical protein
MPNLARILANMLNVNAAKERFVRINLYTGCLKIGPAVYELQIISKIRYAGVRGEHKSEQRATKCSEDT